MTWKYRTAGHECGISDENFVLGVLMWASGAARARVLVVGVHHSCARVRARALERYASYFVLFLLLALERYLCGKKKDASGGSKKSHDDWTGGDRAVL
jgi:hypothetical protein